ncbi:Histidine biosynthesis bifunctional protein hisB [Naganishia adeliensis]|uniref:Histidine biosynthesis bifunctional protein hisB n=1 Tax=Naganishia adeliensis TaxID=92952 RepID=A0ACC2X1F0_9TREE|nr:Histidine biosynthesis bifunctional protein hisB [Naganishia adeliensis]
MASTSSNSSPRRRSQFRPCIDLHGGVVKQIVGGTLGTDDSKLKTNFVATQSPKEFAEMYRKNDLTGGHVIKLGPGNDQAAREALAAWPNGLQVGGGIQVSNAQEWIDAGAEKVIITSALFPDQEFSLERLQAFSQTVGTDRLVVDVSCRRRNDKWIVAMNKWQDLTDMEVNQGVSLDIFGGKTVKFDELVSLSHRMRDGL